MLYFTSQSARLDAVYSGRFAFIANATAAWIAAALDRIGRTPDGPPEATPPVPDGDPLVSAFAEEYRHAQLFLSCRSGLVLGGGLVLVRISWLFFRSRRTVYDYYRLRAAFFAVMYRLHEDAVAAALQRIVLDDPIPDELRDHVRRADRAVWDAWRAMMPRLVIVLRLVSPLLSLVGRLFARHYTVISQEFENGSLHEHNHALGGFANDLYADRSPLPRPIRRWLRAARPESIVPNTFATDWEWMLLKFLAERDCWGLVLERNHQAMSFDAYRAEVLAFAAAWVHLHQARPIATISTAIDETRTQHALPPPPEGWGGNPRLRKLVNFFYLHGN